jgi:multicomponent Na+:H+ antiporter subunit G
VANDATAAALLLAGGLLMFVAGLGVVRLPDLFTRMQAATKAATLGAVCLLAGVAVHFADAGVTARALLVILFLALTAPVAAQRIARAAYSVGVRLWDRSVADELRDHYDPATQRIGSGATAPGSPEPDRQGGPEE